MTVIFGVWFQMKPLNLQGTSEPLNLQGLEKNACGSEIFGSDHQGADINILSSLSSLSSSSSSLLLLLLLLLFFHSDEGHIS